MDVKEDIQGSCKRLFVGKEHCTVYLVGRRDAHIEVSKVGNDVCIEILDMKLPCFKSSGEDEKEKNK